MQPIYFPFTTVTQDTGRLLRACFENTVVFQPLAGMEPPSFTGITHHVPVSGDEAAIIKAVAEYKTWAAQHQGGNLSVLKTRMTQVPFYSETSISNIRQDIKNKLTGAPLPVKEEKQQTGEEALFAARLFLALAHEHDLFHAQVGRDLAAMVQKEEALFAALKGDGDDPDTDDLFAPRHRDMAPEVDMETLMDQRLYAWAQLASGHDLDSGLFVTTSSAIPASLAEIGLIDESPVAVVVGIPLADRTGDVMAWQQAILACLAQYAKVGQTSTGGIDLPGPPDTIASRKAVLTIYQAADTSPNDFFKKLGAGQATPIEKETATGRHTLVCLVTPD